jgi:hypothetical protein
LFRVVLLRVADIYTQGVRNGNFNNLSGTHYGQGNGLGIGIAMAADGHLYG